MNDDVRKVDALAWISLDLIHPNEDNPRLHLHDITDLAASIKAQGLIQPIVVTAVPSLGFRLIAGHRRLAAMQQLGMARALCVIRAGKSHADTLSMMLVENGQRVPLSALEEARAYQALITEHGLSQKELGRRVGRSQGFVSSRLALLHLTPDEQAEVEAGGMLLRDAAQTARVRAGTDTKTIYTGWHFGKTHPLAEPARVLCQTSGHPAARRLSAIACGACFEQVIREDERDAVDEVAS